MLQCSRSFWLRFLKLSLCLFLGVLLTSVPVFSRSIPHARGTEKAAVAIATTPAENLLDQGRQAYAAQRFSEAATVWKEAATVFSNQPLQQALALSYLTAAYQQLGQWEDGDRAITQSLELLATEPDSTQKVAVSAQVHNTLGS